MKIIARRVYSNPPKHGANIVSTVLNDKDLYKMWLGVIKINIILLKNNLNQIFYKGNLNYVFQNHY